MTSAEEEETIIYGDVDLDYLDQVRSSIPILEQKRLELYNSATAVQVLSFKGISWTILLLLLLIFHLALSKLLIFIVYIISILNCILFFFTR